MKKCRCFNWKYQIAFVLFLNFILLMSAFAQERPNEGWLEGTVHTSDGDAADYTAYVSAHIDGKLIAKDSCDSGLDGFYEIRNLKPATYEIRVKRGKEGWSPQRIFGVLIEPGKRSILNITLNSGSKLEEIGEPAVSSQSVIIISKEIERLQQEIDSLKNSLHL